MIVGGRSSATGGILAALVFSMVLLGGCGDGFDGPNYVITAVVWDDLSVMPSQAATVWIRESVGGDAVFGATVRVNGVECDPAIDPWDESYDRDFFSVPPGHPIFIEVDLGEFHAMGMVTMPGPPDVTAPTGSHDASAPIPVEWNSSFVPDTFYLSVHPFETVSPDGWQMTVDGTLASCEIPAGTLNPATSDIRALMWAANETSNLGPLAGSGSEIRAVYNGVSPAFSTE